MANDYRIIVAESGIKGCDAVNSFTEKNPEWKLYNVISAYQGIGPTFAFIFEKPKKESPKNTPPTGGTEAALLTEHTNVVPLRRAA